MKVLAVAAVCEATLGMALVIDPPIVFRLLLGTEASGAGLALSRVAGIALLALVLACWPSHDASIRQRALRAMLAYNAMATLYLVHLGVGREWVGLLLWPAGALHAALTAWCVVALQRGAAPARSGAK